jgi:hypothetical protein
MAWLELNAHAAAANRSRRQETILEVSLVKDVIHPTK